MHAIEVSGLRKAYGSLEAVRGVDFSIEEGEVFGLLGPNGAGKTTTVEILEGYRSRDAGEVRVLGSDPERPARDFRERIGVVLQQSEMWANLTVRETHAIFAGYYQAPRDVDEVIAVVGLAGEGATRASSRCRAARSGGSTSASRSSAIPTSSFSTSRRPASTRRRAARRGR